MSKVSPEERQQNEEACQKLKKMAEKEELGLAISKWRYGSEIAFADDINLVEHLISLGYRKVEDKELRGLISCTIFKSRGWKYAKDYKEFGAQDTAVNLLADQIIALIKGGGK